MHFSTQAQRKSNPRKFTILQKTETLNKLFIFSQKKAVIMIWETSYI